MPDAHRLTKNTAQIRNARGAFEKIALPGNLSMDEPLPTSVRIRLSYADAHGVIVDGLLNEERTGHIPLEELNAIAILLLDLLVDATEHFESESGGPVPPSNKEES